MKNLSIDIETYSGAPLQKCGAYRYAEDPDFEILLFGYSVDGSVVRVVDLACGETIPPDIIAALTNDSVTKWAFNASFERICLSRYLSDMDISLDTFHDKTRHVLYNCTCSRPTIESATTDDTKEPQTDTLSLTALPLANGYVKAKTALSTDSTVYDAWFDAVYEPTITEETTADAASVG